ncbi:MAG: insulinase family protein [Treponema sp.]|nr:insulinase family protein [Treponema sp.]
MKKTALKNLLFALAFLLPSGLFGLEMPQGFSRFVLSNGMTVCVYEDFSAPTARVEYTAKAGFSAQSAATAGYAPLYAALFSKAGLYSNDSGDWLLDELQSECRSDSARYTIDISPNQLEEILKELSLCAFAPIFQDQELSQKLQQAKDEAAQSAFSVEGFINSAIDSRVFSAAPWKHDSGIYPALFQKQSLSEARAVLSEIAQNFYTPQNSALFITGAVTKQAALLLAEKTFGQFAPRPTIVPPQTESAAKDSAKKFVLSDQELSPDMAQMVCQYTSLSMEQADIAALVLNARDSALKQALTAQADLNIRGSDYINADAAHKNSSSRLIIQSLLEKSGADDCQKAALFEKILKEKAADFSQQEFEAAQNFLCLDFEMAAGNPRGFMDLLSQFWAVDGRAKKSYEQSGQEGDASSLIQRFLARPQRIMAQDYLELKFALQNEDPYVFVLLNAKNYKNCAAAFDKDGWQNVTAKNASWHTQEMFSAIKSSIQKSDADGQEKTAPQIFDPTFFERAMQSGYSVRLQNGIGIHAAIHPDRSTSAVCLYIKGGEAESAQRQPGLESVLASVLAQNTRKALAQKILLGQIKGAANASATCQDVSSLVAVECVKGDEQAALEALGEALFALDIVPSEVDVWLSSRKSAQIIKSQAMPRQLYSAAIKHFYKAPLYKALFAGSQDILGNVSFTQILEAYGNFLDSGRLEIIAIGDIDFDLLTQKTQEIFGTLSCDKKEKAIKAQTKGITKPSQKVKITHTFLTDISADKAGPRPAVLVPTTDFADPVQYWFHLPSDKNQRAIFDTLFLELSDLCQKAFASSERYKKMSLRIEEPSPLVDFGALTIFNVQYVSDADAIMQGALEQLRKELLLEESADAENGDKTGGNAALDAIKSLWLKKNFEGADKNLEAARRLSQKIDAARVSYQSFDIREAIAGDYQTVTKAGAADFLAVYEACFDKYCKFYSDAAKK